MDEKAMPTQPKHPQHRKIRFCRWSNPIAKSVILERSDDCPDGFVNLRPLFIVAELLSNIGSGTLRAWVNAKWRPE